MIIGQGVPEISVRIHTHTNYFSNIDCQNIRQIEGLINHKQTFTNILPKVTF